MAMWDKCAVTKSGAQLLMRTINDSTSQDGSKRVEIFAAKYGESTVPDEELKFQENVSSPEGTMSIIQIKHYEWGFEIVIRMDNCKLAEETVIKQVGFYAREKDSEESVLFVIAQDEVGDRVPSAEEMPNFNLEFTIAVALDTDTEISIVVDPTATATVGFVEGVKHEISAQIEDLQEKVKEEIEQLKEPMKPATETESGTAGLVPAPTPEDDGKVLGSDGQWHDMVTEPMKPASETEQGTAGLVPAPTPDDTGKFLGSDGQWHNVPKVEIEQALAEGIKIATVTIDGEAVELYCKDGVVYGNATASSAGLMSAADKAKFDEIKINVAELVGEKGKGKVVVSSTAPTDTTCLWIDTGNSGVIKYYNGGWVSAASTATAVWG